MPAPIDQLDALPPWDAATYFQTITEGSFKIPLAGFGQLVAGDPNRVALIVHAIAGGCTMSLAGKTPATGGLVISSSLPPQILLFSETGPLCQQTWFVVGAANQVVTYYAIALRTYPSAPIYKRGKLRGPSQ